jgi:hypothetical protein
VRPRTYGTPQSAVRTECCKRGTNALHIIPLISTLYSISVKLMLEHGHTLIWRYICTRRSPTARPGKSTALVCGHRSILVGFARCG